MKVVAFVPIKMNSERLPNKNILPFEGGEPLIKYILRTLLDVQGVDERYVYCSDPSIKNYLIEGIDFLQRSAHLDLSSTPFNEVLISFAQEVPADFYVLTHTTAPFIRASSIDKGIQKVIDGSFDSAVGVQRIQEFLWRDGKPLNFELTNIPRTQDLPLIYAETCGLYIYSRQLILEQKRRIGNNPYFIELSNLESIDINNREDFDFANAIFKQIILKGRKDE